MIMALNRWSIGQTTQTSWGNEARTQVQLMSVCVDEMIQVEHSPTRPNGVFVGEIRGKKSWLWEVRRYVVV